MYRIANFLWTASKIVSTCGGLIADEHSKLPHKAYCGEHVSAMRPFSTGTRLNRRRNAGTRSNNRCGAFVVNNDAIVNWLEDAIHSYAYNTPAEQSAMAVEWGSVITSIASRATLQYTTSRRSYFLSSSTKADTLYSSERISEDSFTQCIFSRILNWVMPIESWWLASIR